MSTSFSSCCPTWRPRRTEDSWKKFCDAIRSAEYFDELVIALEAENEEDFKITKSLIGEIRKDAVVIEVFPDSTPIHKRVSGGEVYNRAVFPAKGDFISQLADDDSYCVFNSKILIQQGDRFKDEEIVYFPYYCLNEDGNMGVFMPPQQVQIETLLKCNYLSNSAFISRKVWNELGGKRKDTVCDHDFFLRAKRTGRKFSFFPYPCYMQRFYKGSLFMRQKEQWGEQEIKRKIDEAIR